MKGGGCQAFRRGFVNPRERHNATKTLNSEKPPGSDWQIRTGGLTNPRERHKRVGVTGM